FWEYDPILEAWTELATCPCVERYHPAMVQVNDKIYVGLGANEFGDLDDWWEYDIATDAWTEKTGFPSTERHHPYYFGIGDYVYVGFGHHTSTIFNDFYQYDPATDSWETLDDFPDQGRVAGTQFSYAGKGYILSGQGESHSNLPTGEFWEYDPDLDSWTALTAHPDGGRWAPGSFVIEDEIFFTCGEANTGEKRDMMVYGLAGPASIDDPNIQELTLSPNPSTEMIYLQGIALENVTARIFDTAGKLVHESTVSENNLDLTHLLAGMYVLQIQNEDGILTEKLLIE
ncbi:MAG: T9SS type A sorting domain-containing protein, partial [Flavobacteriaceae bacterium]|nr:T9SS type A sorting domain-containing protein [Flavobacteriaceae bacterium]